MNKNRLAKKRQGAQSAIEAYSDELLRAKNQEQKRRNGRLIKLGVAAEQMFKAGDMNLLARFEAAIVGTEGNKALATRAIDRDDFALDEPRTWFEEMREEADERRVATASDPASALRGATDGRLADTKKEANSEEPSATPRKRDESPPQLPVPGTGAPLSAPSAASANAANGRPS